MLPLPLPLPLPPLLLLLVILTWVEGVFIWACVSPHFAVQLLRLPQDVLHQRVLLAILAVGCTIVICCKVVVAEDSRQG
jgi:ribose/xylose/arabinose/galactoside ABC-type transport system permease subunit